MAVPITLTGADQQVYTPAAGSTGPGILYGWSMSAPAAASVRIRAGVGTGAPIIGTVEIAGATVSETQWFGPQGVQSRDGIFVDVIAGAPVGAIYIG